MGKYDALYLFLLRISPDVREKTLTFAEIEGILDFKLPNSAYVHRPWWSNPSSPTYHPHAQSWLAAGWKVDTVNQADNWARFRRINHKQGGPKFTQASSENKLKPVNGEQFQEKAGKLLSKRSRAKFNLNYPIAIGNPPKEHRFDLVSSDLRLVGECKNYTWTESGNVPSAKIGFITEAVFYQTLLPQNTIRFIVMKKDMHPKRKETLAE